MSPEAQIISQKISFVRTDPADDLMPAWGKSSVWLKPWLLLPTTPRLLPSAPHHRIRRAVTEHHSILTAFVGRCASVSSFSGLPRASWLQPPPAAAAMAAQLKLGFPANCGVLALTAGQARPWPHDPPDMACSSSSLSTSTRSMWAFSSSRCWQLRAWPWLMAHVRLLRFLGEVVSDSLGKRRKAYDCCLS